ncbi:hypothetical protein DPMN_105325 [Dreissena polymorpha]|uniref:Uncharacterized protein n=1 Tax=Dreissena polymorpha TaxID=45954 RepID=A0A9D4HEL4_DREPO|nr:hypothetical protein DPMN_105325 [Dreissena polymorpha]
MGGAKVPIPGGLRDRRRLSEPGPVYERRVHTISSQQLLLQPRILRNEMRKTFDCYNTRWIGSYQTCQDVC